MNEHDAEPGDGIIEELLSQVKQVQPPTESRLANRLAVASKLVRLSQENRQQHFPWWRRRVSVPWPVAASCVLALVVLVLITIVPRHEGQQQSLTEESNHRTEESNANSSVAREATGEERTPSVKYYASAVYFCGLGELSTESRYVIEE